MFLNCWLFKMYFHCGSGDLHSGGILRNKIMSCSDALPDVVRQRKKAIIRQFVRLVTSRGEAALVCHVVSQHARETKMRIFTMRDLDELQPYIIVETWAPPYSRPSCAPSNENCSSRF